jgi:hypothetical protein
MSAAPATSADVTALIAAGCRALWAAGQADLIWGHCSVRDPGGRGAWMKGSGWGFEELEPDRVVLVSPDGDVLDGAGRRHIEYPIHTEIMAQRGDVGAVVHTHSDAVNALCAGRAAAPAGPRRLPVHLPGDPALHTDGRADPQPGPRTGPGGHACGGARLPDAPARPGRGRRGSAVRGDDCGTARPRLPHPADRHGSWPAGGARRIRSPSASSGMPVSCEPGGITCFAPRPGPAGPRLSTYTHKARPRSPQCRSWAFERRDEQLLPDAVQAQSPADVEE